MGILAGVMFVSVAPQFWERTLFGVPVRLYVWYLPLISYWVGRAVRPHSRTHKISKRSERTCLTEHRLHCAFADDTTDALRHRHRAT